MLSVLPLAVFPLPLPWLSEEPPSDETVPLSEAPVLAVSLFPLEVGSGAVELTASVELPEETGVPTVLLLPTPLVAPVEFPAVELPVVELPVVEFPEVVFPVVVFPADELPVELVELETGTGVDDELDAEIPLQILQEFSRMTAPNLVLIHSAMVSIWYGRSTGFSIWRTSAPWLFWNEVTLKS